jgi:hypothetical protein
VKAVPPVVRNTIEPEPPLALGNFSASRSETLTVSVPGMFTCDDSTPPARK